MRFSILLALIFGFIAACAFGQDDAQRSATNIVDPSDAMTTPAQTTAGLIPIATLSAMTGDPLFAFVSAENVLHSQWVTVSKLDPVKVSSVASAMRTAWDAASSAVGATDASARAHWGSYMSSMATWASNNPAAISEYVEMNSALGLDFDLYTSVIGSMVQTTTPAPSTSANTSTAPITSDTKSSPAKTSAASTNTTTTVTKETTSLNNSGGANSTQSSSSSTSDGMAPATAFPYAAVGAGFLLVGWL